MDVCAKAENRRHSGSVPAPSYQPLTLSRHRRASFPLAVCAHTHESDPLKVPALCRAGTVARSVTKCACFGSGGFEGLAVIAVVCGYWFLRSCMAGCPDRTPYYTRRVASPAVHFNSCARRNLCRPIRKRSDCASVSVVGTVSWQTAFWWTWRESNPRPNAIFVASYSHSGEACPE